MQLIQLSKLDQSEDNVCKRPNPEFEERLSFDIEARGVLQNLIVAKAKKRGRFEVIGGGKRMRAMLCHRINDDDDYACPSAPTACLSCVCPSGVAGISPHPGCRRYQSALRGWRRRSVPSLVRPQRGVAPSVCPSGT